MKRLDFSRTLRTRAQIHVLLRVRWQPFFSLLLFVAVSYKDGLAQSNPVPPVQSIPLSLKNAVQLALKQNPQLVASRLVSLESDRQREISRSALLPQASLTATGLLAQFNVASIERTNKRATSGPYQMIQAGPAFSQSLLDLPLFRSYQISREGVREAHAQENATREDIIASVVTQYILSSVRLLFTTPRRPASLSPNAFTSKRRVCKRRESA
jgi:outer membrane protein TolC